MKVVIQNGAAHPFPRAQAEAMVALFPGRWLKTVKSLTFYQARGSSLEFKHHPEEQALGMFWPSAANLQPTPVEAVHELLVALAIVAERGNLPSRVSSSLRAWAEQEVAELAARCAQRIERQDAEP